MFNMFVLKIMEIFLILNSRMTNLLPINLQANTVIGICIINLRVITGVNGIDGGMIPATRLFIFLWVQEKLQKTGMCLFLI